VDVDFALVIADGGDAVVDLLQESSQPGMRRSSLIKSLMQPNGMTYLLTGGHLCILPFFPMDER